MITKNLNEAIRVLNNNQLIAIPTETVYGLAGNALREKVVEKIFTLKNRPFYNPLIVHISSKDELTNIAKNIPNKANILAEKFWPGPLTLVLPKLDIVPNKVTANKNTVAVRVPNHSLSLQLLKEIDFPLAAPSANPFASISPTTPQHVENYFKDKLRLILDGGICKRGIESTIIGFDDDEPVLYRLGSLSIEQIELAVGKIKKLTKIDENKPQAPGMLSKHYAPKTPFYLIENIDLNSFLACDKNSKLGILRFQDFDKRFPTQFQEILSTTANLNEAAKNLYAAMHRLDAQQLDLILAEKLPEVGIGLTLNDKLRRAAQD
ncbi:L-threonylcarbamoyladenylate synthase [Psychroflexus planctonicus]|uniref:Threonylcarbamoyl-AMP synthase n=1 Tax=Psychroflexus planctonicus TaxID=1526575 RepID=A0ABQ1SFE1_9FLAO|nr:L-threonylcarbamoyladenylate synthase [Psychroflexus planctonicus]GGE28597.1 threonylcarbamoyl-AMP synthase [Psychroflexus planctonicus]